MRLRSLLAAVAALACIGLATPDPAAAFGDRERAPEGWGRVRPIHHWVYYPRHVHHYHVDPYAYRHSPRGYYPYYNSQYWRPAHVIRQRNHKHYHHWNVQPPHYKYYPSWGKPQHWHHGHGPVHKKYHRWHY